MSQVNINSHINWKRVLFDFILTMIFPIFVGIPRLVFGVMKNKMEDKTKYAIYIVCISAIVASIIATKPATGDQITYAAAYANVPEQGFVGSLINIYGIQTTWEETKTHISAEFMNGVYNYVGYYLTFGYYPLFLLFYFTIEFSLIGFGLYHYCRRMERPLVPIVFGMLFLLFFYLFFLMCSQLQKQYIGQAIMMYVLGCYADYGKMTKKLWVLSCISIFTHQSMMLFLPFLLFKPFHKKLSMKSLMLLMLIVVGFIKIGPLLTGGFVNSVQNSDQSILMHGAYRFASATEDSDGNTMDMVQFLVVCIPLFYIFLKRLWFERNTLSAHTAFILNIVFMLTMVIIAMSSMPLVQYRYFNTTFAFLPFVYPFFFTNTKVRDIFLEVVGIAMVFVMFIMIPNTGRPYAPLGNLIFEPPFLLVLQYF